MSKRIENAIKKLAQKRLDALLISSAYNIGYLTGFFGFSKIEREGYLLLTKDCLYFFASGLNNEAVEKHISSLRVNVPHPRGDIASHLGKMNVKLITISPRSPLTKKALASIIRKQKVKRLGFEKNNLTFIEYEKLKNDLKVKLIPTENFIEELRMIKEPQEIKVIEKACKIGDRTFDYILKKIKPGISEKEFAFEIELFIRKNGAGISFSPIVAIGSNSSIPHHTTSNEQRATRNHWILLDFGVKIDNYCSDMSRTVFFGKANKKQRRMYQTVLESQKRAIECLNNYSSRESRRSGTNREVSSRLRSNNKVKASDVDKIARSYITSQGYPTIPHSLGHGIGLEVHEPPRLTQKSKDILKPGMVFSIEPGIYQYGIGGIRIEDLVILESTGPRFLTKAKREFIEI